MAKAPKKRDKKGTRVNFKQREIDTIVNHAYYRVKFIGDCFHPPMALSIQKLWTHLRGASHDAGMSVFMRHISREMDWSITFSCFFKLGDDLEELEVVQAVAVCRQVTMKEMSAAITDIIIETVNTIIQTDDRFTLNNIIYYTYLLSPEFNESHFKLSEGLTDLMINVAQFDKLTTFDGKLLGTVSNENTMHDAIERNRVYPRVKTVTYFPLPDGEEDYDIDPEFLYVTKET